MRKLLLVVLFVLPVMQVFGGGITSVSMNSFNVTQGQWNRLAWNFVDIDDFGAVTTGMDGLVIPANATRGRCSFRVTLSLALPHTGIWRVKMVEEGSAYGFIPQREQNIALAATTGVFELSGQGRWFTVNNVPMANRAAKTGDTFYLEVWVSTDPGNADVTASSWFQCEWVVPYIFADGFESGDTSRWSIVDTVED